MGHISKSFRLVRFTVTKISYWSVQGFGVSASPLITVIFQANDVCGSTLPRYIRMTAKLNEFQAVRNCPDLSDELCLDPCVPGGFAGRYTMKVCS